MLRTPITMAALAFCAGLAAPNLSAQGEEPTSKPMSASEEFQTLQRETTEAVDTWRAEQAKKAAEAKAKGGSMPAVRMRPPVKPFVDRAVACAKKYAGTEDAVQFHTWIVEWALAANQRKTGIASIRTLLSDHVASPGLGSIAQVIPQLEHIITDDEERTATLDKLEKQSPVASLRGWAMLARLGETIEKADKSSPEYATAKVALLTAAKEADDSHLMGEIQGKIDLREKFGIGNVAPDIAGTDLDGVDFKLSDYKGKVIFLDFWGDW